MVNTLRIFVENSPETNDHQARLIIDGRDWLGSEYMGLDPPMLAAELLKGNAGTLILGRCCCGAVGCSDRRVEVSQKGSWVHWTVRGGSKVRFDAARYDAEIRRFAEDRSWETVGRTVEREIGNLFRGTATEDGWEFDWASTRIEPGLIYLSFSKNEEQRLLEFSWDGVSLASALQRAQEFRAERSAHCN